MASNPLHVYRPLQAHSVVKPVEVEGLSYNPLTGKTERATHRINIIQEHLPTPLAGAVGSDRLVDHMKAEGYSLDQITLCADPGACFLCGEDAPYELVDFIPTALLLSPADNHHRTWRSCTACKTAYELAS